MSEIAPELPPQPAPRTAPRASRAGLLVVGALVVLATVEAGAALLSPRRVASEADWQAAAAEVRAGFKPGDLIVFAPRWSDAVGRKHLGDLVTPEMAGRADASRYARIWEVSIRGAHAPETLEVGTYPSGSPSLHGRVRVALYSRSTPITPLYDFTAHLAEARVSQTAPDAPAGPDERTCGLSGGAAGNGVEPVAFRCATTSVERRTLEVDFAPRRGVLAPADGTRTTRVEWDSVPLGNTLAGWTGIHDWHSRKYGAGPVDFKVFVDGAQLYTTRLDASPAAASWRPFLVPTLRYAGTSHAVRFEVSSPPGATERRLGFHVESRREAPPVGTAP